MILGELIYQELRIGMIKEWGMVCSDSARGCTVAQITVPMFGHFVMFGL